MNSGTATIPEETQYRFTTQLWHLTQGLFVLALLYGFIAHVANVVYALVPDGRLTDGLHVTPDILPVLYNVDLNVEGFCRNVLGLDDKLCNTIIAIVGCIVVGTFVGMALGWICEREWVKEKVQVKECWEETTWYNPWEWVKSIVCTFVEVIKWVFKYICQIREFLIWGLIIICAVVVIILFY